MVAQTTHPTAKPRCGFLVSSSAGVPACGSAGVSPAVGRDDTRGVPAPGSKASTATAQHPKQDHPLSPAESMARFKVAPDLQLDQVLAEPLVRQPVFMNFDERGRLWVVEYLQYPSPAGLKMLSHDSFWRSVYDKVPPPPPHHFKGADRITIYEDTAGNGIFDSHKTFLDGLNIVTAVTKGRGGVWVLNPPYLLFYPDKNNDDIPDGDPEVRLSGFGLEDTHSVVNSLRWGPERLALRMPGQHGHGERSSSRIGQGAARAYHGTANLALSPGNQALRSLRGRRRQCVWL